MRKLITLDELIIRINRKYYNIPRYIDIFRLIIISFKISTPIKDIKDDEDGGSI